MCTLPETGVRSAKYFPVDEGLEAGELNERFEVKGLGEGFESEGDRSWTADPGDESDDELLAGPLGGLSLTDPVACPSIPLIILQLVELWELLLQLFVVPQPAQHPKATPITMMPI